MHVTYSLPINSQSNAAASIHSLSNLFDQLPVKLESKEATCKNDDCLIFTFCLLKVAVRQKLVQMRVQTDPL